MSANGNCLDDEVRLGRDLRHAGRVHVFLGTVITIVKDLGLAYASAAEYAQLTTCLPRDAAANIVARRYRI